MDDVPLHAHEFEIPLHTKRFENVCDTALHCQIDEPQKNAKEKNSGYDHAGC
jgi:hypothetical protein